MLAIISLAGGLRRDVDAEGVETEAQLDFLRANGCDEMAARDRPHALRGGVESNGGP